MVLVLKITTQKNEFINKILKKTNKLARPNYLHIHLEYHL